MKCFKRRRSRVLKAVVLLSSAAIMCCPAAVPSAIFANQLDPQDGMGSTGASSAAIIKDSPSERSAASQEDGQRAENSASPDTEETAGSNGEVSDNSDGEASPSTKGAESLQYVYVDRDTLSSSDEQNILISLADESVKVEHGALDLERVDTGEIISIEASQISGGAMLFTASFPRVAEYRLTDVTYSVGNSTDEIKVSLVQDDGSAPHFEVVEPQSTTTSEEAGPDGITAYTFDDEGNPVAADSVADAIEQADSDGVRDSVTEATSVSPASNNTRAAVTGTREDHLIVAIDAGHGGSDPGATGYGLRECDLTYSIAEAMQSELSTYAGVTTIMTRSGNDANSYVGVSERAIEAAQKGADVFVSIHINAGGGTGSEVYVPYDGGYENDKTSVVGYQLAEKITAKLEQLGLRNRGIKSDNFSPSGEYPAYPDGSWPDYLGVIRESRRRGIPGILIEEGFIDNEHDASLLASESVRHQMGVDNATSVAQQYNLGRISDAQASSSVKVDAHIADLGWESPVYDQKVAGSVGKSKSLQAFTVELQNAAASVGGIRYRSLVNGSWQDWKNSGEISGTTGQNTPIEAIKIELTGGAADQYDVYYRLHVADIGWLGWAKDGDPAGTCGYGNDAQAMEVVVVPKGSSAPGSMSDAYRDKATAAPTISYRAHVQDIGWQAGVNSGATAGTTGLSKHMEALELDLELGRYSGSDSGISIEAHCQDLGWISPVASGQVAGTTGQSKRLEAIKIQLSGAISNDYDIYYRVHVQDIGWMSWAKDGEEAGTQGYGKGVEAIQIVLQEKGQDAPIENPESVTADAFKRKPADVSYRAHVSSIGWQASVAGGATAGTTGRGLSIEALSFGLTNADTSGGIEVNAFNSIDGWMGWASDQAGTTGQSRQLEAIKIRLTGEMSDKYDIWYRVHSAELGWLGWTSNGDSAGSEGFGYGVQALQVVLKKKGDKAPGSTENPFKLSGISYRAHVAEIGWQNFAGDGAVAGTTGRGLSIQALNVYLPDGSGRVKATAHIQDYGWVDSVDVSRTEYAGTVGEGRRIEAVCLELEGDAADRYDLYYRVHSSNIGWLDWAKNGDRAGTQGFGYGIEAIQIELVDKGSAAPGPTGTAFRTPSDIMGASLASTSQMAAAFKGRGYTFPAGVYSSKGASSIEQFCELVNRAALAEGVRADVVFAQAMKETGWLQFGGSVDSGQCNFAGLGATGGANHGYTFPDVYTGLLAQVQHLKAYASTVPLNTICVDPRFGLVSRGCAPQLEQLDGRWAVPGKGYGESILSMINEMLKI